MSATQRGVWLIVAALISTLSVVLIAEGCQSVEQAGSVPARQTIIVYGFSIEEEAVTEEVFPAFQAYWRDQAGQEVTIRGVFTGSEQLTEMIMEGAPADIAILSNEQHAVWLHVNDRVETDWHTFPNGGIVSRSPLVIVVRPGNPLGIRDWADLGRPGVELVHADPRKSGGAQWALVAEYGSALMDGNGGSQVAREQLKHIWANVIAVPSSSREALRLFMFGTGDALVTYEQDALLAQARGAALEIVIPHSTVMSEHVVVVVDGNVKPWEREAVEAFVAFLWSEEAQTSFTRYYFRAVTDETLNEAVPEFHKVERPFTVQDLGGWAQVYPEIIRGAWEDSVSQ